MRAHSVTITAVLLLAVGFAGPVLGKDRPVTDQERASLASAIKAAGCTGGTMEFDDDKSPPHPSGKFEVDDAMCGNQKHDLVFDHEFRLISKKAD